jgi:uncharacterized protein (TIGR02246 family)
MKGTRLVGQVEHVRFLSPDVALMHAVGGTVMRGKSEPSTELDSMQTLVATRQGGEWCLAAFQCPGCRYVVCLYHEWQHGVVGTADHFAF